MGLEVKTGAQDVLAQDARLVHLPDGVTQAVDGDGILGADIEVALGCADGIARNHHALDDGIGVALQNGAVHEGTGVALVTVADHVLLVGDGCLGELPLPAGGETTAAARLGISQPALSSAIHNLENALGGVKLFEKVGRNIRLTDEGRFYQENVDEAIQKLHSASMILRESKTQAPIVIRMGVVSGTLDGFLAREIVKYTRENKRIRFHLTESSSENLMDLVRQEKLDMAIIDSTDRDRSLHFRKLYERDYFVALPVSHPMADRSSINPREVVGEPQVVFNYNVGQSFKEWTTGSPADEAVICTVDTSRAALDLVSAGIGITFIPNECVENHPGIRYVPLKNWHQALYMCILYDKWLEPPVWDFIEAIVKGMRARKHT